MAKALEGGESDIISTHHVFNELQREHPDVVETLVTPNWYFDRKGEVSEGQEQWYRSAIMFLENDPSDSARVWAKFVSTAFNVSLCIGIFSICCTENLDSGVWHVTELTAHNRTPTM